MELKKGILIKLLILRLEPEGNTLIAVEHHAPLLEKSINFLKGFDDDHGLIVFSFG